MDYQRSSTKVYTCLSSGVQFPPWVPKHIRRQAINIDEVIRFSFKGETSLLAMQLLERLVAYPYMRKVWQAIDRLLPSSENSEFVCDCIFLSAWVDGITDFDAVRQEFRREDERITELAEIFGQFNKKAGRILLGSKLGQINFSEDQKKSLAALRQEADMNKAQYASSTLAAVQSSHPSKRTAFVRSYAESLSSEAGMDVTADAVLQIIAWVSSVVFQDAINDFKPSDIRKILQNQ